MAKENLVEQAAAIVKQAFERRGDLLIEDGAATPSILGILEQIGQTLKLPESKTRPNVARQIPIKRLVVRLERWYQRGYLHFPDRKQAELFSTGSWWNGGFHEAILYVGPKFPEEFKKRPDSVIAEMLWQMARAVLVDAELPKIGNIRKISTVRKRIIGYLATFPPNVPMTSEQRELLETRNLLRGWLQNSQ